MCRIQGTPGARLLLYHLHHVFITHQLLGVGKWSYNSRIEVYRKLCNSIHHITIKLHV
jgi:hypothetical protein